jgi:F-type H+-transporting ATPase subunit alpha
VFSRFGAIVDPRTQQAIRRGRRIRRALTQPEHRPLGLGEEVALLLALTEGLLDDLELDDVDRFKDGLAAWLKERAVDVADSIANTGELDADGRAGLLAALRDLAATLQPAAPAS